MPSRPNPAISRAIAELRLRSGTPIDVGQVGPVPLRRFFERINLLHQEMPSLSTAVIVDFMVRNGYVTGPHVLEELTQNHDRLDGFLFWAGAAGMAFVNADAKSPLARRRFTAAHELGHAILHRETMGRFLIDESINEADDQHDQMEREANQFAAELLMPAEVCHARADALRRTLGDSNRCPRGVLAYRLAAELLVSREAMRYRLQDLEVGDE